MRVFAVCTHKVIKTSFSIKVLRLKDATNFMHEIVFFFSQLFLYHIHLRIVDGSLLVRSCVCM